jgi:multiple sugar transport system permease protein
MPPVSSRRPVRASSETLAHDTAGPSSGPVVFVPGRPTRRPAPSQAWQFLLPAVALLALITIYPFLYAVYLSLHDIDLTRPYLGRAFVGLGNYIAILRDPRALNAFLISILFVTGAVGLETAAGLATAMFFRRYFRMSGLVTTLILIPMLIPRVVVALLWRVMYNPLVGILDYWLGFIGLGGIAWVSDPILALPSVIIADLWQWAPFITIILMAGLEALPEEPFEAAQIDGATGWQTFWGITVPLLMPVLLVAVLFRLIDALRSFDLVFVLTGGGPGTRTETVDIFAYFVGISQSGRIGYAAAAAIVMLYATLIFANYLLKGIRAWQGEGAA